jgi:hypothetical protein
LVRIQKLGKNTIEINILIKVRLEHKARCKVSLIWTIAYVGETGKHAPNGLYLYLSMEASKW